MFDIGFSELMVVGVVALIVLGPERLPKVARMAGQWLGKAQRYVNDVKADIAREGELAELKKLKSEMETAAQEAKTTLDNAAQNLEQEVQSAQDSVAESYKALQNDHASTAHIVASTNDLPNNAATDAAVVDPAVDVFAPLPEPQPEPVVESASTVTDPVHELSTQRKEADSLITEITKLEERLAQLRRNAQAARNIAA
jgi:sec-independent protein translocase protein TatB